MGSKVAIIAGAGRFPFYVAREAKRQGHGIVAIGLRGWADGALKEEADAFEAEALKVLGQARDFSVPAMLGLIAKRLEADGIALLDSSTFLRANLCPEGALTSRGPNPEEQQDIHAGLRAARLMAALDVGQTVVVKRGVIVAV